MKKKIQLTTGLCAAVLALSLATTTFADEQTTPVTSPITERQDRLVLFQELQRVQLQQLQTKQQLHFLAKRQ